MSKKGLPADAIQLEKQLKNESEILDKEKILDIFERVQSIYQFVNHAIHKLKLTPVADKESKKALLHKD